MLKKTIIVMVVLLIVAGCSGNKGKMPVTDLNIFKGIEGIVLTFLNNAPPSNILEGEISPEGVKSPNILPIGINIANKGSFDVQGGFISVIVEKDYMTLNNDLEVNIYPTTLEKQESNFPYSFKIAGKSLENPIGENGFITLSAAVKKIDSRSEKHSSDIMVSACYPYQTKLAATVCIDSDIYNMKASKKACTASDISLESQGAPVAITKIETKMLPHDDTTKVKPRFIISIENKGKGDVINKDKLADFCNSVTLSQDDWNRVIPTISFLDSSIVCDKSELRLKDKKGKIVCTFEEGIEKKAAFTTILGITIDYGYMSTISKKVIIEKSLTY